MMVLQADAAGDDVTRRQDSNILDRLVAIDLGSAVVSGIECISYVIKSDSISARIICSFVSRTWFDARPFNLDQQRKSIGVTVLSAAVLRQGRRLTHRPDQTNSGTHGMRR
jgi:hypothetical protein